MKSFALPSAVALILLTAACNSGGGSNNPAAPTPQIPNVVGNYSGTTVMAFPELGPTARIQCPTTTSVTQAGSTVNIAPFVLRGECGNLSIPAGQMTIDATGSLGGIANYTFDDPTCGGRYSATASGGFFGRELRISINAVSNVCYNLNMTITVTR